MGSALIDQCCHQHYYNLLSARQMTSRKDADKIPS
jgi:hypothetical protein